MNFKPFAEIIRPQNCAMASIATFIGYAIAAKTTVFGIEVIFAMASAFLICGAGQAINDFFDLEVDKKIRPNKTLPAKKISKNTAFIYSNILFLAGLAFAFFVNSAAFGIALAFSILLYLYSALIQKQKFFGNIVVALGTAFTLVFGASIVQKYDTIIFLAASAFFANMGREITKDAEDKEADKGYKKTLPMILSQKQTSAVVLLMYACAITIAASVWVSKKITNWIYVFFIAIAALAFFYSFFLLFAKKEKKAQEWSKIGMLISLIAFFSGAF